MKEMIQRAREKREGFTMAELLIVVAIIAVLVAIAIPVFTGQLHKAQDQTEIANARSIYAECQADFLTNSSNGTYTGTGDFANIVGTDKTSVTLNGQTMTFTNGTVDISVDSDAGYTVVWNADENCSAGNQDMTFGPTSGD